MGETVAAWMAAEAVATTAAAAEATALAAGASEIGAIAASNAAVAALPMPGFGGFVSAVGTDIGSFYKANQTGLSIGGNLLSGAGAIMGGYQQAGALGFEKAQYEMQAENTKLMAAIDTQKRMRQLNMLLEGQRAIGAGRGYSEDSPSFQALQEDTEEQALGDIGVQRLNIASKGRAYELAAMQSERTAASAITKGYAGAAQSLYNVGKTSLA